MKRKIYMVFVFFAVMLLLAACSGTISDSASDQEESSIELNAMDTYMALRAYGENRNEALDAAKTEIERLDDMWSVGKEDSEVSILNESQEGEVSDETIELIECAQKISEETGGAFDITIYPLMDLWGFTTKEYQVPEESSIQEILMNKMGMDKVTVDKSTHTVTLSDGAQIDFGGVAKGYTSQSIAKIFEDYGVEHGIISLGGNIQAIGTRIDGSRWRVGIEAPNDHFDMVGTYEAEDEAIITSGAYERYFEEGGKTYHHILDPETGKPAESDLISVTIVSNNGTEADCLSTALFVLGKEKAIAYWKEHSTEFDFILVDEENHIYISEGIENHFESSYDYEEVKK